MINKILNKKVLLFLLVFCFLINQAFSQDAVTGSRFRPVASIPVTTWVLDDFDDHASTQNLNQYNGGAHTITWGIVSSRYITVTDEKPYPQYAFVSGFPAKLPTEFTRERETMRIFAIRAAFNTKDVNEIKLKPTDQKTVFVDENGRPKQGIFFTKPVYQIGLFALGLKRDYLVTAVFELPSGQMFEVVLGDLNYQGWEVLAAPIPVENYVKQEAYINSGYVFRLDNITVRTSAQERVDDFVLYFDHIYYTQASISENYFDGYELSLPSFKSRVQWETTNTVE